MFLGGLAVVCLLVGCCLLVVVVVAHVVVVVVVGGSRLRMVFAVVACAGMPCRPELPSGFSLLFIVCVELTFCYWYSLVRLETVNHMFWGSKNFCRRPSLWFTDESK